MKTMSDLTEMPIDDVVNRIVTLNNGLRLFWSKMEEGWAPTEAAQLLSRSRLDWQVSLSRCLKFWLSECSPDENDGRLILAWTNLGSLVEGTMKLFLSVYYVDFQKDDLALRRDGSLIDPDTMDLDKMRQFFRERFWQGGDERWDSWILHIQQRRNAVHAFKNRDIGTLDEFYDDVRKYLKFLRYINEKLPYPGEVYIPREF
jgi:hypothetical protein